MDAISTAIASLGVARDMAKGYLSLKDEIGRQQFAIDMQSKILDAQSAALDAQAAHQELKRHIERLETEIATLKDRRAVIATMSRDAGFYFLPGDPDPFCPHCIEGGEHMIHVGRTGMFSGPHPEWLCPACKNVFLQQSRFKSELRPSV